MAVNMHKQTHDTTTSDALEIAYFSAGELPAFTTNVEARLFIVSF